MSVGGIAVMVGMFGVYSGGSFLPWRAVSLICCSVQIIAIIGALVVSTILKRARPGEFAQCCSVLLLPIRVRKPEKIIDFFLPSSKDPRGTRLAAVTKSLRRRPNHAPAPAWRRLAASRRRRIRANDPSQQIVRFV